ncbi:uncharacterized protein LOC110040969 [Orbicella faveolata]|uniref:uncharacterized protein LOC110040969 n=1 Tax=Orbicella faveolata TaxID=48498 RepID=UPI0009E3FF73|nr:uncharacterized protein LOC110040969 [Orbicella faveolata]
MLEQRKCYAVALFGIYLVTVQVLSVGTTEVTTDSCQMVERFNGKMVNMKNAREKAENSSGIVSVPEGLMVNSSAECEQGCCDNINCTVYLFYPRPPTNDQNKKYNCFILNCRPQSLCSAGMVDVSSKAEGSVVGIRDLLQGNTVAAKDVVNLQESVSSAESKSDVKNTSTVKPDADVSSKKEPSTSETKNKTNTSETSSSVTATTNTEGKSITIQLKLYETLP